jgi:hypothetical protein
VVTPYGCERGELFEGSWRREERGLSHPGSMETTSVASLSRPTGAGFVKRGEPQDRQRDATSPRLRVRRKPSRWCETTRTERGWTGGAVGPRLFGATGIGSREGPGPGVDAHGACRWRGEQVTNPRRGRVPVSRSELRLQSVLTARDPAVVRTLRRRRKRSRSADEGWFAIRKRHLGEVLEGPGPVTVEGRGGRRKYPTTCSPRIRGDTDAGFGRRRSAGLEDHPDSTEAALSLAHRASPSSEVRDSVPRNRSRPAAQTSEADVPSGSLVARFAPRACSQVRGAFALDLRADIGVQTTEARRARRFHGEPCASISDSRWRSRRSCSMATGC